MRLGDLAKQVFADAAEHRRENWKKQRRISFYAEGEQCDAFHILYNELVNRYGKEGAVDALIACMAENETRLRETEKVIRARKSPR